MNTVESCYACGHENPLHARFCGGCGTSLQVPRCPSCGSGTAPGSAFCGQCGSPLSLAGLTPVLPPEDQLRSVTVVFALLSGVQTLVEQCDPEEQKEIVDTAFRLLTAEVVARGGTIDKYMADSLMALFGVPLAHEDDPARAVGAALGMLEALEPFNRQLFASRGFQLELKIGVNTGRVLVGKVGHGQDMTVMGDVVNTASRVEHAAPVGGVLICESTRRALGNAFLLREMPPLEVKGKTQPLKVFRVLRVHEGQEAAAPDLNLLPLMGREEIVDALARAWRQAVRPDGVAGVSGSTSLPGLPGSWLSLVADVGMGKGRVLRELSRYLEQDPLRPRVLKLRASAGLGRGRPLLRRLLEGVLEIAPEAGLEALWQRVLSAFERVESPESTSLETFHPEGGARALFRLLGLPGLGQRAEPTSSLPLPELRREGAWWLRKLLERLALERPLALILDDLHEADDTTLESLEELGADLPGRILLVTAGRPTLLERRPSWGARHGSHRHLSLPPLTRAQALSLIRAVVGDQTPISGELLDDLMRFTGGNPLFLTETLRAYLESRRLETLPRDAEALLVPTSLEGVLQSRLDRLPFEAGLTLRAAGVLGSPFWRGALTALLGSDRSEALQLLVQKGFIQQRAHALLPGEVEYVFEHALTARVAASNLLEAVRKRYHLRAAEWLEAQQRPEPDAPSLAEAIADHFEAADEGARALPARRMAASRALKGYDGAAALAQLTRALELLGGTQDEVSVEPTSGGGVGPERVRVQMHAEVRAQRGEAHRMLGQLEQALADLLAAARLYERLGQAEQAASSWFQVGLVQLGLGQVELAHDAASRGEQRLQHHPALEVMAMGHQLRGELALAKAQPQEARTRLEQGVGLWRRLGDKWRLGHGLHTLGRAHLATGEYAAAQRVLKEASSLRERLGDAHGLALTLHNLGAAADRLGSFPEALAHYHRSLRLHRRVSNRRALAATLVNQGVGYCRTGYFGRALVAFEESLELYRALNHPYAEAVTVFNLGFLRVQVGQAELGLGHIEQARQSFEALGDMEALAEVLAEYASCLMVLERWQEAEQHLEASFTLCQQRHGGPVEARTVQLQGTLALLRQDLDTAQARLEELEWIDEMQVSAIHKLQGLLLSGWLKVSGGQTEQARARFKEALGLAREKDLAPLAWRAQRSWEEARYGGGLSTAREAQDELWQELAARVETPELTRSLRQRRVKKMGFWL
ncbi:MAG: tetratricopeptide repeat protein [Myxococcota bacterium]